MGVILGLVGLVVYLVIIFFSVFTPRVLFGLAKQL